MRRRDALAELGAAAMWPRRSVSAMPAREILIFGHRGASALRPEHTLASYAKAIADGADYIEPDLVCTRDGVLIARHENNIVETTDVATRPEFASRKAEKLVDGTKQLGWFVEDFTLAELKTLRAKERLPQYRPQNAAMDGRFDVPSWQEIIDFTAAESAARGKLIGLVPELKHSTYFARIGLPLEDRFLASLAAHDYTRRAPLEIQSFEIGNLKYLRRKLGRPANIRLMQLIDDPEVIPADVAAAGEALNYRTLLTPAKLKDVAAYADVLSPWTRAIIPVDASGRLGKPTTVVADAHKAGLLVRPYTFRPENVFLAADFRDAGGPALRNPAGSIREIQTYLDTGIDGFFTDDPGIGREALTAWRAAGGKQPSQR